MSNGLGNTLVVGLFGSFAGHEWHTAGVVESDAYSLFVARSSAMGWLAGGAAEATGGLWGMNDAGADVDLPFAPAPAVWFQVSVLDPVSSRQLLPVQPMLACARDVVARLGTLDLQTVQLLLPMQLLTTPTERAAGALAQEAGWFAD